LQVAQLALLLVLVLVPLEASVALWRSLQALQLLQPVAPSA